MTIHLGPSRFMSMEILDSHRGALDAVGEEGWVHTINLRFPPAGVAASRLQMLRSLACPPTRPRSA